MQGLAIECNICGYIGDDRSNHDCSAHMQKRIAALTARAEQLQKERDQMKVDHDCAWQNNRILEKARQEGLASLAAEKAARERAEGEVVRLREFVDAYDRWIDAASTPLRDCADSPVEGSQLKIFAVLDAAKLRDEKRAALEG